MLAVLAMLAKIKEYWKIKSDVGQCMAKDINVREHVNPPWLATCSPMYSNNTIFKMVARNAIIMFPINKILWTLVIKKKNMIKIGSKKRIPFRKV